MQERTRSPLTSPQEKRSARRRLAKAPVGLREKGRTWVSAEISDLSHNGCCLKLTFPLVAGERLWIKLPTIEPWAAYTAWIEDGRAGLSFERPLHPAVSDLVVRRAMIAPDHLRLTEAVSMLKGITVTRAITP